MKINVSHVAPGRLLNRADAVGSVLSSLCAVHCLCMPVLIGLLPALGLTFLAGETFERTASLSMVLLAAACVGAGCRVHRRRSLLVLLAAGAALVLCGQFSSAAEETGSWREPALMAAGGSLVAVSHFLNRRLRARCSCGQCQSAMKKS